MFLSFFDLNLSPYPKKEVYITNTHDIHFFKSKLIFYDFFITIESFYITFFSAHLPLINLIVKIMPLIAQSENIPIHTAIGPNPQQRHK